MIAIIGGDPGRFRPLVDLYRRALTEFGRPQLPIGVHSPGFVGETDDEAREVLWPHYRSMRDRIGAERGWGPASRSEFEASAGPSGSLYVGSATTVADKIAATVRALGVDRFTLKYSTGTLPHEQLLASIQRYGEQVAPLVRLANAAGSEPLTTAST